MAGTVSKLPLDPPDGGDGVSPADIYKVAVEEYRFQAQFNWSRTQYLLAFNAAILATAVGLMSRPGRGPALVFVLGAVTAVLAQFVVNTQQDYYRAARDRMSRIERDLEIPEAQRVDTTATLGGRKRLVSVNQVVRLLLAAVTIGNLVGVATAWFR